MRARRPLTDERRQIFLEVLRQTGSMAAACSACTPHSSNKEGRPGHRTIIDAIRRDPEFAQAVEEAKQHALGLVEEAIAQRSMTPERVPIFAKGEIVGWKESWRDANALLLKRATVLDPDRWTERRRIDGEIKHHHAVAAVVLTPQDILMLPKDQREQFIAALELIAERSQKEARHDGRPTLPPAEAADGGHAGQSGSDAAR